MTETKEYPMPTVHMNGTSKEMLLEGNTDILHKIHNLEDTICNCVFHGRDYYVHPLEDTVIGGAYGVALEERQKHLKNLLAFREYIEEHINHIVSQ
tara:strand:+ start:193 stop:480 length:288 start_codon:yes stop_codon:yes gene_type:complete